jgi:membrane protease YdiL (CAAX protease family)
LTRDAGLPAPRPPYLAFLPGFLFRTDEVKARYVLRAWLLAFVPSMLLSWLVAMALPAAEAPPLVIDGILAVAMVVLFAPLVETLIMVPVVLLLQRLLGFGPAVVASAVLWGIAHSLAAPVWGLVIWWPFLIFSIAMLTWRRQSLVAAVLVVFAIHAVQNSGPALLILVGR